MLDPILKETSRNMEVVKENFAAALKKIHSGRANPALVEDMKVNFYHSTMPLKQLGQISVPDPMMLVVTPWDRGALQPIETAIREAGLNLQPVNDGSVVRIKLPPLSAERRQDLIKLIEQSAEEAKVGLRQVREEAWKKVKELAGQGTLTEDDRYRGEQSLNKLIAQFNDALMAMARAKETSIET